MPITVIASIEVGVPESALTVSVAATVPLGGGVTVAGENDA